MFRWSAVVLAAVLTAAGAGRADEVVFDAKLPPYQPGRQAVSGAVRVVGSETMSGLVASWADSFRRRHPDVEVSISDEGSDTAVTALSSGQATLGAVSRPLRQDEQQALRRKSGRPPITVTTGRDMIAVVVHHSNPLTSLSAQQLRRVFGDGDDRSADTWGDLGLKGEWAGRPVLRYGRNELSGTTHLFLQYLDARSRVHPKLQPLTSNAAVVKQTAADPGAIGFAAFSFSLPGVKPLALPPAEGRPVPATARHAADGSYPLARRLTLIAAPKGGRPTPADAEFLRYILSREGQEDVVTAGFIPLDHQTVQRERAKLNLD